MGNKKQITSSLLDEAIVDSEALLAAAQKYGRASLVEQYSKEFDSAVSLYLEQGQPGEELLLGEEDEEFPMPGEDEMGLGEEEMNMDAGGIDLGMEGGEEALMPPAEGEQSVLDGIPLAATAGQKLCICPDLDDEVEINFKDIIASVAGEEKGGMPEGIPDGLPGGEPAVDMGDFAEGLAGDSPYDEDEEFPLDEGVILEALANLSEDTKMKMDVADEGSMALGDSTEPNTSQLQDRVSLLAVTEEDNTDEEDRQGTSCSPHEPGISTEDKEESERELPEGVPKPPTEETISEDTLGILSKFGEILEINKKLIEEVSTYKQREQKYSAAFKKMKKALLESTFSEAKLHYTNLALTDHSMNERQRSKIVEQIEKAGSIETVKVIFEALKNTSSAPRMQKAEQTSLREMLSKHNSLKFQPTTSIITENKRVKAEKVVTDEAKERMKKMAGLKTE